MIEAVLDLVGAICIAIGALLCFAAAVSLVRFPDVLGKMHAITKPQVLGLIFVALGIALSLRSWWASGMAVIIVVIQLLTAPVSANLVARGAYRGGLVPDENLLINDLTADLEEAGYSRPEDAPRSRWRT